jgi:hypothetical protein
MGAEVARPNITPTGGHFQRPNITLGGVILGIEFFLQLQKYTGV